MLHHLKEKIYESFYTTRVKTVDVQLGIRQETLAYSDKGGATSLGQEKIFILDFQGLTISRDSKSSINQSISMAIQLGRKSVMVQSQSVK